MHNISFHKILVTVGLLLFVTACTPVQPWERGYLAKSQMALDTRPEVKELVSHVYSSREAATGGSSASGGGCGCY